MATRVCRRVSERRQYTVGQPDYLLEDPSEK
jgi:hypothetical protein